IAGGVAALALLGVPLPASAQPGMTTPAELEGVTLQDRAGDTIDLDVLLMNDAGEMVRVGDYFNDGPLARTPDGRGKPAILALVYYDCPVVCPLTMERLRGAMNRVDYTVGEDFNVLVVSIDHTNTTDMALREKLASLLSYNRPETPAVRAGWAYHTATAGNARRLADSVGFQYTFIADAGEYAHAPGLVLITPDGRVSRYIDGLDYVNQADDIQLGLVEAGQGSIAPTLLDRLILFCFHYDPSKGSYTVQAVRVMQIGGVLCMLGIAGLILVLRLQEKARQRRIAARGEAGGSTGDGSTAGHEPPTAGSERRRAHGAPGSAVSARAGTNTMAHRGRLPAAGIERGV
ncbi:MAG: SCO family protein, partial [Phycisphaerales bacterium]|nr:SCO family protein [Phycisphaerales bacterium]